MFKLWTPITSRVTCLQGVMHNCDRFVTAVTDLSILVTDLSISTLGVHVWRAFPDRNRILIEYIREFLTEFLSEGKR